MATVMMSVRVDADVKEAALAVAKAAGFPLSTLVNAYLRQLVATRHIDFYAPKDLTPRLESLIEEAESGADRAGPFANAEGFPAALHDDDGSQR
jgi:addiction module RelB/DinJ family antitoxin